MKKSRSNPDYNLCNIAYDKDTSRIVLLKDITENITNGKSGINWKELICDWDFEYHEEFEKLESGIYQIEFTAWSWEEHTENGSDGDSGDEIISIKKLDTLSVNGGQNE